MDKEDCVLELLSTLQKPLWKSSNSATDWDLKSILWKAGLLLNPEQAAGLLADMRRRGLIAGRERRGDDGTLFLWGIRITPVGEDWVSQTAQTGRPAVCPPQQATPTFFAEEDDPSEQAHKLDQSAEVTAN